MDDGDGASSRRTRAGLLVVLGLAVAVVVAVLATTSLSNLEHDDGLGQAIPWLPRGGPTRRISGRVVSPGGDPIARVGVQLVYEGDPHWPETVAYETTTDAAGEFAFDGVATGVQFMIVVSGQDARRTFDPPSDPDAADLRVGDIRLAPDQPVRIVVRCTSPPPPPTDRPPDGGEPPRVTLRWLPGDDLYAELFPGADDAPPDQRVGESSRLPGRHTLLPPVPRSARRFVHETRLPAGRFLATVDGPCGVAQREVEIQPGEAQVVELASPVPEHGFLIIEVASDIPGEGAVYVHLKLGPASLDTPGTRPGRTSHVSGLAPGTYGVNVPRHACPRAVAIPPRGAVRMRIGRDACTVTEESEPTATPP